jgi:Glycosyl hydrolases family 39
MAIPRGYRRLEGSECRPAAEARRIGAEDPAKALSVTIRVIPAAGEPGGDRVAAFARTQGCRVDRTSASDEIIVSGTVAQLNAAFAVELGRYAWGARSYRGCDGFLHLPGEIAELIAEVSGLIEGEAGAGSPWCQPGPYRGGRSPGGSHGGSAGDGRPGLRVIADWTVPNAGPSGPVHPGNYAMVSSFDIDWLNTPGFQVLLDNLAASPGAFKTVRVMKVLNSGTAELGIAGLAPAADSVWPYNAAGPVPIPAGAFDATISGLTQLTQRGLVPYVVLGFFPAGVYSGTEAGLPLNTAEAPYAYGPSQPSQPDWTTIRGNWSALVQAFFQALFATFGDAINDWWFEVWNEPDNPTSWAPDANNPKPLSYYCQLYQETVQAITDAGLPGSVQVSVGGPAIMANSVFLEQGDFGIWAPGAQTDLQIGLPAFLDFVYNGGTPLPCDFISVHAKGDWTEGELPDLSQNATSGVGVIYTVESVVSQFTSQAKYHGYFDGKPIVNSEADMRVGFEVPFWPRMTSQYPAWLTALMIASDSLTSQYAANGAQFVSASDNAHPELTGWQEPASHNPSSGAMSGEYTFGQQRSIMTAASSWAAGTPEAPVCPQDLVKVPVYNFYELVRLLGDQHGVFISGQNNFYPTDPNSSLFSAITVGVPSGELTHVCWVFCVYPTDIPSPTDLVNNPVKPLADRSSYVEVIGLPGSWHSVNWVQFQIGQAGKNLPDRNSFTAAGGNAETFPSPVQNGQLWEYYVSAGSAPGTQLSLAGFNAGQVRANSELGLVRYLKNVPLTNGAWESPAAIDFEPYSATAFWITPYDISAAAAPTALAPASYAPPSGPPVPIPIAALVGNNVVIRWSYPPIDPNDPGFDPSDPRYYSFFYFEVQRNQTTISPVPATTPEAPAWSFALRATMWVDTAPPSSGEVGYVYSIRAWSASGTHGPFLDSPPVVVP